MQGGKTLNIQLPGQHESPHSGELQPKQGIGIRWGKRRGRRGKRGVPQLRSVDV
jgi:hypothetical protein